MRLTAGLKSSFRCRYNGSAVDYEDGKDVAGALRTLFTYRSFGMLQAMMLKCSSAKPIALWLLTIAAGIVLLLGLVWLAADFYSRLGTYKMLFPGKYDIALQPGEYELIVFTRWKSKRIDEPDAKQISMEICTKNGMKIPIQESPVANFAVKLDSSNRGGIWGGFRIAEAGTYSIMSSNKCVLIAAPASKVTDGFGGMWVCPGSDDDFGFAWPNQ